MTYIKHSLEQAESILSQIHGSDSITMTGQQSRRFAEALALINGTTRELRQQEYEQSLREHPFFNEYKPERYYGW